MRTANDLCATSVGALLPRAQAGDRQAMNDLLRHITPFVGRLCLPIARKHSCDAAQEAMLAIYRGIPGLREPTAFYSWVRSVTVREAIRTSKRLSQGVIESLPELAQDANPLVAIDIRDVMDRLPEQHREVLTLRAVYGMNEREMAATLALPIGTVRSRLHRARRKFQAAWTMGRA
ncbi:RNA polymerase sigma factor [Streptomyces palmae]|uniref:RNA polymerase sigma factor n=1 Tax=Streptomyces palmae TaxID=1701085 RepID=UPI001AE0A94C|nr:RNA polymerase sigma factor [Streptomyces palmae]